MVCVLQHRQGSLRNYFILPVKVNQSRYTPCRRLGERRYSSYSFTSSALDGVSGQSHASATLYPRGRGPCYPLYSMLGGPQSRSGHRGYRKNHLPLLTLPLVVKFLNKTLFQVANKKWELNICYETII
jgi:hypothetical protein